MALIVCFAIFVLFRFFFSAGYIFEGLENKKKEKKEEIL